LLDDLNDAFLTGPRRVDSDAALAEVAQTGLEDGGQKIGEVGGRLIQGSTEQPIGLWMGGCHGESITADVELSQVAAGEVEGVASTGRVRFEIFIEEAWGIVQDEVRRGLSNERQEDTKCCGGGTHDAVVCLSVAGSSIFAKQIV